MSSPTPPPPPPPRAPLTAADVRHVAKLARLELSPDRIEQFRSQLTAVLDHIAQIADLDVDGVEPLAHPAQMHNRLDDDIPGPSLTTAQVLANAPAVLGDCLVVPKVLGADAGGGEG